MNSDVEIQAQFTLNQSRIEEITMKEDIVVNHLLGDEGFGDIPFDSDGEKEIMRGGPALEESLYQSKDISKITLNETDTGRGFPDSTFDRSKISKSLCKTHLSNVDKSNNYCKSFSSCS